MANNFIKAIDRQMWVQVTPAPTAHAAGMGMCSDLRNNCSRNPLIYQLGSAAILNKYNTYQKGWMLAVNPGISAFGAGAGCVFAPSLGLSGSISAGSNSSTIITSTAMTTVANNMLANRGGTGDYGFKIRVIGNSSGGSGLVEERWIIGNSAGTTPSMSLDTPLTFTPAAGDTYEILSGRVFCLGNGALAATSWRSYEVATNTLTSLSNTNLPATVATDFSAVALDEQYVPYDFQPGEGFVTGSGTYDVSGSNVLRSIVATAAAAGTITGQAADGDASVLANEYRNFQIRIVSDPSTPTAVNQRRIIASHTAGPSAVYTLGSNWTVTPSANAKFVIEYPNLILLWSSATAVTYTYNYTGFPINNGTNSINGNAWHVTYFGNRGGNMGAGCTTFCSFGIQPDPLKNARHSYIYSFRGGGVSTLDLLDIAGGTTGAWSNTITYDGNVVTPTTATSGAYAPYDNEGKFGYLNIYVASALNQMYRFDVKNRTLTAYTPTDWIQTGTATAGTRIASIVGIDGTDKYSILLLVSHATTISQEIIVQI